MRISVDKSKCVGCRTCELVCSWHHEKVFNPDRALIKVSFDDSNDLTITVLPECRFDKDSLCVEFCPTQAISANE